MVFLTLAHVSPDTVLPYIASTLAKNATQETVKHAKRGFAKIISMLVLLYFFDASFSWADVKKMMDATAAAGISRTVASLKSISSHVAMAAVKQREGTDLFRKGNKELEVQFTAVRKQVDVLGDMNTCITQETYEACKAAVFDGITRVLGDCSSPFGAAATAFTLWLGATANKVLVPAALLGAVGTALVSKKPNATAAILASLGGPVKIEGQKPAPPQPPAPRERKAPRRMRMGSERSPPAAYLGLRHGDTGVPPSLAPEPPAALTAAPPTEPPTAPRAEPPAEPLAASTAGPGLSPGLVPELIVDGANSPIANSPIVIEVSPAPELAPAPEPKLAPTSTAKPPAPAPVVNLMTPDARHDNSGALVRSNHRQCRPEVQMQGFFYELPVGSVKLRIDMHGVVTYAEGLDPKMRDQIKAMTGQMLPGAAPPGTPTQGTPPPGAPPAALSPTSKRIIDALSELQAKAKAQEVATQEAKESAQASAAALAAIAHQQQEQVEAAETTTTLQRRMIMRQRRATAQLTTLATDQGKLLKGQAVAARKAEAARKEATMNADSLAQALGGVAQTQQVLAEMAQRNATGQGKLLKGQAVAAKKAEAARKEAAMNADSLAQALGGVAQTQQVLAEMAQRKEACEQADAEKVARKRGLSARRANAGI